MRLRELPDTHIADVDTANRVIREQSAAIRELQRVVQAAQHAIGGSHHSPSPLDALNALITGGNLDFDDQPRPHDGSTIELSVGSALKLLGTDNDGLVEFEGVNNRPWRFFKSGGFSTAFTLAHNAFWNGSSWERDNSALNALRVEFYNNGIQIYRAPSDGNLIIGSWDQQTRLRVSEGEVRSNAQTVSRFGGRAYHASPSSNAPSFSTNFRKLFLSAPSSFTFSSSASNNVNFGPTVESSSIHGLTAYFGTTGSAASVYWTGTVTAS